MKKFSVIVEAQEYTTIDDHLEHVGWIDSQIVEDFHDEDEAKEWVDENALDTALSLIGKNPDEVLVRMSDWSSDGQVYRLDLEDDRLFVFSVTFEVHPLTGRFPWPESC